jgi:hypothetical protein
MPVCLLSSLMLEGDVIVFEGPGGANWRLPLSELEAIGEFTRDDLAEFHFLAFFAKGEDGWFQAPMNAVGAAQVLKALSARLGEPIEPGSGEPSFCGRRLLWPRGRTTDSFIDDGRELE